MTYEIGEGAGRIADAVRSKNSATMNCGTSRLAESIYYQWIRGDTGVPLPLQVNRSARIVAMLREV
jgi:hypothetical protein